VHEAITQCRICGNRNLVSVLHLGEQALTGVFPRNENETVTSGPLELVKCHSADDASPCCGLLQLRHSYRLDELYGTNYGYRSGLNPTMVAHLHNKVARITGQVSLAPGNLVIDIGSNDSTLLQGYGRTDLELVGFDPTGVKFHHYYPKHIGLVPDFFSRRAAQERLGSRKAKIITSIAMFYDLEDPTDFMAQVRDCLADDGVWVFEQSYMPTMLDVNAYDTVCHEHLEYYGLEQIKWMTDRVGLEIVDVELNAVNGGSFSVMVRKARAAQPAIAPSVARLLAAERDRGLHTLAPYEQFRRNVFAHRDQLVAFVAGARRAERTVFGYGASTKGNVILQFCGLTRDDIPCIAEVNPDKFGCFTPGTRIPIVSEADAKARRPDYLLVLPWHFRDFIVAREASYVAAGGRLVFPLPSIRVEPQ
jgi:hypothetical protein